ncbi:hypothetical protein C8F04DRAFT_1393783 [Mycena alexandri]|uniref:Uncharacterized protein n=1 Tax=Mycena alexandri TaxID=1745969 RepID=A0AAD6X6H2_9AGAR|nr:hypothetical protein C8F04DRAFT_1393783 [Mycena alexandri]
MTTPATDSTPPPCSIPALPQHPTPPHTRPYSPLLASKSATNLSLRATTTSRIHFLTPPSQRPTASAVTQNIGAVPGSKVFSAVELQIASSPKHGGIPTSRRSPLLNTMKQRLGQPSLRDRIAPSHHLTLRNLALWH